MKDESTSGPNQGGLTTQFTRRAYGLYVLALQFKKLCQTWFARWLHGMRSVDGSRDPKVPAQTQTVLGSMPSGLQEASPLYHYCIARADLPFGVQIAQVIHAAGESSPGELFIPPDTRAVALAARDEAQLIELEQTLIKAGINHVAIREPDEPWLGALMAIGVTPQIRTPELKKLMKHLPLIK